MLRYIIWAFILYWLFRFVFNFLIPVFKATRQMKQQMRAFQGKMEGQENVRESSSRHAGPEPQSRRENQGTGDYIEFEEIK